ncbi:MAG: molybdopterin-guanine dinucleotide biosynthesis protein B [Chloroflexi bacterium]|nr:molybdopterin-guanine dinucleotide biosynthesis protein B [Chloroflexota bacterium]
MPPIVSIVGKSGAGKTTLLEALIPALARRGYRVAVIKHSAQGFDMDREGKDSDRLQKAGANPVALASSNQFALLRQMEKETDLEGLLRLLGDGFDLILTEGFREARATKIEVHRRETGELHCSAEELWAVVTDEPLPLPVLQFRWEETEKLADLIETTYLKDREEEAELFADGRPVPLNPFVREFLARTVRGMVSALRGIGDPRRLEIRLWKK